MKRIYILIFFLFYIAGKSTACDYCNCYLGLNPHFKKNTLGLRYHYMFYKGTHHDDLELEQIGLTKNDFHETRTMYELFGKWYPVQKLQVLFSLPYINNTEKSNPPVSEAGNKTHETIRGIGDPVIIANYQLFNTTAMDDSSKYSHRMFAGAGIKIPAGKWHLEESEEPLERIHLPGSGAAGYIANMMYIGSCKKIGVNINASYLFTTTNSEHFRFGNLFNMNALFYYKCHNKKVDFYPNAGAYLEQAKKDRFFNMEMDNSGGTILYGNLGMDFYFHKISLSAAAQLPVIQSLNENQPHIQFRLITGVNYAF